MKPDNDLGSTPQLALNINRAAMLADGIVGKRQPQSCPLPHLFTGYEGFKNVFQQIIRNTFTLINYPYHDLITLSGFTNIDVIAYV
jgi:hypothetical protein